jgi:acetolactate decarboxylase
MPMLTCPISQALEDALKKRSKSTGEPISHLVVHALSECLGVPLHTLFQVSTSGALVQGIYERAVSSQLLLRHGDFGLGTFENLDGEMVVLDGAIYQVRSDGAVTRIVQDVGTPFAVVLPFAADQEERIAKVDSLEQLTGSCDRYRASGNLFCAFRIDGHFHHLHARAVRATADRLPLPRLPRSNPSSISTKQMGLLSAFGHPSFPVR